MNAKKQQGNDWVTVSLDDAKNVRTALIRKFGSKEKIPRIVRQYFTKGRRVTLQINADTGVCNILRAGQ